MSKITKKIAKSATTLAMIVAMFLSGFPVEPVLDLLKEKNVVDKLYWSLKDPNVIDQGVKNIFQPKMQVKKAEAANFSMRTGYYVGTGSSLPVTGLGFQPDLVIVKSDTGANAAMFKTSAMAAANTAYFVGTADNTASNLALNADGFTLGTLATLNTANVRYAWIAFGGSDCSSGNGTFCVGTYTGTINPVKVTTNFAPALVLVKRTNSASGNFRTTAMADNMGQYFHTTAQDTAGNLFTTMLSDGFNVGATNNASGGVYNYVAFKAVDGVMGVGSYLGTGAVANIDATGFAGVTPSFVFVKNATSATANNRRPMFNITESYGNYSGFFYAAANATTHITGLRSGGFSVGAGVYANEGGTPGQTIYYAAFGGAPSNSGSGTYQMANGHYTGNGGIQTIDSLSFAPDLVIIKHNDQATDQYAVFKTRLMAGDITAYFAYGAVNFAGGITSLNADGFSVGSNAAVNTSDDTYYWTAFGNAWNPTTHSGAADFAIGAYTSNYIDNRNITQLPFQPNFVAVKGNQAYGGAWRTSAMVNDISQYFHNLAEAANIVQNLNSAGFQIGTAYYTNRAAGLLYHWFAFQSGSNFVVDSYTGNGATEKDITTGNFSPDLIWTKKRSLGTATGAVLRTSDQSGDAAQPFLNAATIASGIKSLLPTGFHLGSANETNENTRGYQFAAWNNPNVPPTLSITQPDGNGDTVTAGDSYNITYNLSDADAGDTVTVDFYYDDDTNSGNGYTAINDCQDQAKGTGATCSWDTTGIAAGDYYIYGIASDGINSPVTDYSPDVITIQSSGTLSVLIVDGSGTEVSSPSVAFSDEYFDWSVQQSTGILGFTTPTVEKVRVTNTTGTPGWTLSMAATSGPSTLWSDGSHTYDFNGTSSAGRLQVTPTSATVTPQGGCSATGLDKQSSAYFDSGNSVDIIITSGAEEASCYWDITGVGLTQDIPASQNVGAYSINMTLTAT